MRLTRTASLFGFVASVLLVGTGLISSKSHAYDNALTLPQSCTELEDLMRVGFSCSRNETPWKIVKTYHTCKSDIEVRDRMVTKEQCGQWEQAYNDQYDFISKRYEHLQGCLKARDVPVYDAEALTYCRSVLAAEAAEAEEEASGYYGSQPQAIGVSGALTKPGI